MVVNLWPNPRRNTELRKRHQTTDIGRHLRRRRPWPCPSDRDAASIHSLPSTSSIARVLRHRLPYAPSGCDRPSSSSAWANQSLIASRLSCAIGKCFGLAFVAGLVPAPAASSPYTQSATASSQPRGTRRRRPMRIRNDALRSFGAT
jgi:hypothetical protein